MTQPIQVLSLGSDTHERKIRQAAGLASLPVFTALSVWEAVHEVHSNRCQILVVELPYSDLDAAELISTVRSHDRDIMVIFHLPVGGVVDATRLARMRYQGGASSYLEVLTTDTNLFSAQLSLAAAQQQEALTLVQLYSALGGGWQ